MDYDQKIHLMCQYISLIQMIYYDFKYDETGEIVDMREDEIAEKDFWLKNFHLSYMKLNIDLNQKN